MDAKAGPPAKGSGQERPLYTQKCPGFLRISGT